MNPNSINIYYNKVLPNIKGKHTRVMGAIDKLGEATVYEVAEYLNTAVHNISGRITELSGTKEYGKPVIEAAGKRNNKYGNPCTIWKRKVYFKEAEQVKLF